MISLTYSKGFLKLARRLPKNLQEKLAKQLEFLQQNPFHPFLHTKLSTGPLVGFYSFRITRDWRVIFQFKNPEVIKLIGLGHRKDIYR